jgi:hypothetical protein
VLPPISARASPCATRRTRARRRQHFAAPLCRPVAGAAVVAARSCAWASARVFAALFLRGLASTGRLLSMRGVMRLPTMVPIPPAPPDQRATSPVSAALPPPALSLVCCWRVGPRARVARLSLWALRHRCDAPFNYSPPRGGAMRCCRPLRPPPPATRHRAAAARATKTCFRLSRFRCCRCGLAVGAVGPCGAARRAWLAFCGLPGALFDVPSMRGALSILRCCCLRVESNSQVN